jgi:hypothetical protein
VLLMLAECTSPTCSVTRHCVASHPFFQLQSSVLRTGLLPLEMMLGVREERLSGRGRGVVAESDLAQGSLLLVSPALALSSTSSAACAFCFSLVAHTGVPCRGGCGLVWCSEVCRKGHEAGCGAEPMEPLLVSAPHTDLLCRMLALCGQDSDARLVLEVLARSRGRPRLAEHAGAIVKAAQVLYACSAEAESGSLQHFRKFDPPAAFFLQSGVDEMLQLVSHHARLVVPKATHVVCMRASHMERLLVYRVCGRDESCALLICDATWQLGRRPSSPSLTQRRSCRKGARDRGPRARPIKIPSRN